MGYSKHQTFMTKAINNKSFLIPFFLFSSLSFIFIFFNFPADSKDLLVSRTFWEDQVDKLTNTKPKEDTKKSSLNSGDIEEESSQNSLTKTQDPKSRKTEINDENNDKVANKQKREISKNSSNKEIKKSEVKTKKTSKLIEVKQETKQTEQKSECLEI